MGRRNRRASDEPSRPIGGGAHQDVEEHDDGDWVVRRITGAAATKTYRCPGCDQEIHVGIAHVVAYPSDRPSGEEHRRHWHTPCWGKRGNRAPVQQRGRGPKH